MTFNPVCSNAVSRIPIGDTVCELGNQRNTATWGTTKEHYLRLGYQRYVCIDVNEEMDAYPMDLNQNLRHYYGFKEQFHLATRS